MGRRIKRIVRRISGILCIAALLSTGIQQTGIAKAVSGGEVIHDVTTAMAADGYELDHAYVKPGDTLRVLQAQDGVTQEVTENVTWTVKKVTGGGIDNQVFYETVDELDQPALPILEEYLECIIYGEIADTKLTIYCSKIPVIYINTETEYYDVTKDYTDEDTTSIHLVGNDTYTDDSYWYNGTGQIKLRGNSTAYRPKRPFKVKLSKKADLLGLGNEIESDGTEQSYKSKHWVLLANDTDHSLLRNKLLYDFSGDIGTEFYFHSTNVTMIYNGQYEGVYQLCEHRRVDPGRIDITDWTGIGEGAAESIAVAEAQESGWTSEERKQFQGELETIFASDYSWIDEKKIIYTGTSQPELTGQSFSLAEYGITLPETNGGYLAEMDFYSIGDDTLAGMATNYQQPLYFSAPEPGEDAATVEEAVSIVNSFKQTSLYKYAGKYTQTFEYALHSDDFYFNNSDVKYQTDRTGSPWSNWNDASYKEVSYSDDENDGKHYSELFDMDSLVNNFIFCEYAMNWDSMKNSFFYYKDVDQLAKIGPQWDFDWCWGNTNMFNIQTNYPTEWQTTIDAFTAEQYYQSVQWNRMLIRDPYFLTLAFEKYKEIRPTVIEDMIQEGGLIDQYETYLKEAGAANDARWDYTYDTEYSGATADNFEDSVAHIKNFLKQRVQWLDQQFASISTLIRSLGYYKTSDDIVLTGSMEGDTAALTAAVKNDKAAKICFQINGTTRIMADVEDGMATLSLNPDQLNENGFNMVVANAVDSDGNYLILESASRTGNYNVIRSDYLAFDLTDPDSFEKEEDFEILTGSGWWSQNQRGKDYTLTGNGTVELDVEVQELILDGSFTVELVAVDDSGNEYYLTTNTNKDAWTAEAAQGQGTLSGDIVPGGFSTLIEGHTYRITVWRSGRDFSIQYYDQTAGEMYAVFQWSGGNMPDTVNVNIIAQTGTYKVTLKGTRIETPAEGIKPPASEDGPPVSEDEPPVSGDEPPVSGDEPPASEGGLPGSGEEPPASETDPPAAGNGSAASSAGESASGSQSPAPVDSSNQAGNSVSPQTSDSQTTTAAPGRAVISSIKNKKKKTVVFKIKKVKKAVGYQYSYATNKKFKKSTTKTTKKRTVTIKKLKKKKTYYVRVRAYKKVDGEKKFGKWSKVKKITIKK